MYVHGSENAINIFYSTFKFLSLSFSVQVQLTHFYILLIDFSKYSFASPSTQECMHQMNAAEEIRNVRQQPKTDVVLEQFEKINGYVQNVLIFTKEVFELAAVVTKKEED